MGKLRIGAVSAAVILGVFIGLCIPAQAKEKAVCGFVQEEKGVRWRNLDGTWAVDCWIDVLGRKYHTDRRGYIQVGLTEVDGKIYYLNPDGTLGVGLITIGEDTYFFQADGTMAVNVTIDGNQFGADGKLMGPQMGNTTLAPILDSIIASVTTPQMTEEQKLAACYNYMINACSYKRTYDKPSGDWTWTYAVEILTTGQGNCYRYAAGFACLAKRLGFETKVITGQVKARRGGTTPHGWTEVKMGDTWYIFDTELQDALGGNYYKKTYANYPTKPLIKEAEWEVYF